jgi:peptidoglycan/LPS O-acetylase OafA/YrhL
MTSQTRHLAWLDPIKAFALVGVLLNHLVEQFGRGPWFTNPARNWPPLAERLQTFFPADDPLWIAVPRFLGWLGDAMPGVFILASGLGLAWSFWQQPSRVSGWVQDFFRRRLVKLYPAYWGAHLLLATLSVALPVAVINLGGLRSLASLMGIRATDELFFHINPSWWFVWAILQLYLLFPVLVWAYGRLGGTRFLILSLLVTVGARGFGILYVDSLYYWMTGLCGLTRLAEFSLGIWAAGVLLERNGELTPRLATAKGSLASGLPIYAAGLLCSVFLPTTVVSNLLSTAGLALISLGLWHGLRAHLPALAGSLTWLGGHSYGIYLLHQIPLKWAVTLGSPLGIAFPAALGALAASIPVGVWLETRTTRALQSLSQGSLRSGLELVLATSLLVVLFVVEPVLPSWIGRTRVVYQVVTIAAVLVLCVSVARRLGRKPNTFEWLTWWALLATAASTWIVPPGNGDLMFLATLPLTLFVLMLCKRSGLRPLPIAVAAVGTLAILGGAELALRRWAPLETNVWGELPALTRHPTRVYGLKPSTVTHLRYNNYDYVVESNSQGLNGPEIATPRPSEDTLRVLILGNAFTMPEGLHWRRAYPALVEARLSECVGSNSVQVINAGVTGYSPTEKLPAARELASQYKPDVIIDQFFPTELDWMAQGTESRLQSIGLAKAQGSRVERLWGSLQLPLHWRQLRLRLNEVVTRRPSEWRFQKALLRYFKLPASDAYTNDRREALESYYRTLASVARSARARLMVLYVPAAVEVQAPSTLDYFPWTEIPNDASRYDLEQAWRFFSEAAGAAHVSAYSLKPALRAKATPAYFSASWHWTEAGHRAAAQALIDVLVEEDIVPRKCGAHEGIR